MRLVLAIMGLGALASEAAAQDMFARYFPAPRVCYARAYDAAHLRAHPRQTVLRIMIDYDRRQQEKQEGPDAARKFTAGIGFVLKRSPERYGQVLTCTRSAESIDCFLDADGGRLRLTPAGKNLRLEAIERDPHDAIGAEGEKDYGSFGGPKGDDRVFILAPAPYKACDISGG